MNKGLNLPASRILFSAVYDSVYGHVKSRWKRENGTTTYAVTIPAHTSADVILPDGSAHAVVAGTYRFSV